MKKKYRLKVILGESACNAYNDNPRITYEKLQELGDAKKVSFETEEEMNAYIRGLEDASGWMEVCWEKLYCKDTIERISL